MCYRMITISLKSTTITIHIDFSFLIMRTVRVYSPSNFQVYNTVLTIVAMLNYTYLFYNWRFVPFDPLHPSQSQRREVPKNVQTTV